MVGLYTRRNISRVSINNSDTSELTPAISYTFISTPVQTFTLAQILAPG